MRRAPVATLALAALAALAAAAAAQDAEGVRLRLEAFFSARDEAARKLALSALEGVSVPRDLGGRVEALRRARRLPARKGASRIAEKLSGLDAFFVTPRGYDTKKLYPAVLSLHGRGGDGHQGLQPFALPDEEWNELIAKTRARLPANAVIRKPKPKVPWEDGLVLAPSYGDMERAEEAALAALERAGRDYAADPDKVVICGISLGGAAACEIAARHPDRFAGLVAIAGYDPNVIENLKPLPVYLIHGAKDDDVPVAAGRQMDALLKQGGVTHVYREIPNGGHRWPEPEEGAKLRAWMRARVRAPWPKSFVHRFEPGEKPRRCFWVEVPAGKEARVEARCEANEVSLEVSGVSSVVLHLGEPLVDLEKDVVVKWGEKEVFRGKLARSWGELLNDLEAIGFDFARAAPARVEVNAPER